MTYILITIAIIIFSIGEIYSKLFAINKTPINFPIAFICYTPAIIVWLYLMATKNNLTTMSVLWGGVTTIISILIGLLVFKETVSLYNIIGITLAAISFILLWK